ncbi:MAG: NUDIX hydrolase [Sphingobacteriales bacterium]|jgi:8-oxo-dGTP pyrophosphatase MutT (NUDIX family)
MRYKIYFGDAPLFLTDELDAEMQEIMHHDDGVYMDELSKPAIKSMIHEMKNPQHHAGVYFHANLEELKKMFWKQFTIIKAAGGLVENDKSEILMIFRRGKWDLPKGKLDDGETLESCAVREVEEETGIRNTLLENAFTTTYHVYDEFGKHVLKESYWYTMKSPGHQQLVAQAEEQITAIAWASKNKAAELLSNTYPLVRDLMTLYWNDEKDQGI